MTKNDTKKASRSADGKAISGAPGLAVRTRVDQVLCVPINALKRSNRPLRKRSDATTQKLIRSVERFGLVRPILIDGDYTIIDGEGVVEIARYLGFDEVPAIPVNNLTPAELKALRITLNRLQELGEWDEETLRFDLETILEMDETFELDVTGFELPELDRILFAYEEEGESDEADQLPSLSEEPPVSRLGDRFLIGDHVLYCGDALSQEVVEAALGGRKADCVFTDPPYNVPIDGHVSGLGAVHHREFAIASGELTRKEFAGFLKKMVGIIAEFSRDGALLYCCMDWRSIDLVASAFRKQGLPHINLCVWVKSNGGMGSFYRSRHELVWVARKGDQSHTNNVQLGRFGRNRTNVWEYPGLNSFAAGRMEQLHAHPTVKPVAMIRDAILDSTKKGECVLDLFGGSGSTMIAAEQCKRHSCLIELDPLYVDLIIRRFEQRFGITAIHEATGLTLDELAEQRRSEKEDEFAETASRNVKTKMRVRKLRPPPAPAPENSYSPASSATAPSSECPNTQSEAETPQSVSSKSRTKASPMPRKLRPPPGMDKAREGQRSGATIATTRKGKTVRKPPSPQSKSSKHLQPTKSKKERLL